MIDLTTLSEEEKAVILAKRAYKRAWNAKNKDKVKAINDRFYKKQAEKLASKAQKETNIQTAMQALMPAYENTHVSAPIIPHSRAEMQVLNVADRRIF